ncbi:hypothetical protein ABEY43_06545 [Priestia megaterium]
MANRDINDKYKKCKFDADNELIVEYAKDGGIYSHRLADVFQEYTNEEDDRYFDLTLKESKEITPASVEGMEE